MLLQRLPKWTIWLLILTVWTTTLLHSLHPGLLIALLTKLANSIDSVFGYALPGGSNLPSIWKCNTRIGGASSTTGSPTSRGGRDPCMVGATLAVALAPEQERAVWKKKKSSSSWTTQTSTELPGRKVIVWTIATCSAMWARSDFSSMRIATSQSIQGTNIGWTEKYRNYGVLDIS